MEYKTLDEQTRDVYYNEGFEEGFKEGIEETQINTFNKLLKEGWSIEEARELVNGTEDQKKTAI